MSYCPENIFFSRLFNGLSSNEDEEGEEIFIQGSSQMISAIAAGS
jgi:hypothetical protein